MKLSRRDFLKVCGASAAMLGVGAKIVPPAALTTGAAVPLSPKAGSAVLIDTTRCIGCRLCQTACKQANDLPQDPIPVSTLSATALSVIQFRNVSAVPEKPVVKPVKFACMHCQEPACVSVCPVGALYKREDGTVAYDENICIGCRYCMTACPFGIPKYNWNSANPKINKCAQNCVAIKKLDRPACVQICPVQALQYGSRNELLTIAKDRIAKDPAKYVNQVYGENVVGGTSRLYLSGTPFEQLGFRTDLPTEALPELTWNAQSKIPFVLGGVVALLSGIAWWTHRSEREMAAQPLPLGRPLAK